MSNLVTHTLMVHACLSDNDEERRALVSKWEQLIIMDDMAHDSFRLVPLFLHKNQKAGITTRYDARLKVIYKHWWLKTQHILNQLKIVYRAFQANGIRPVVIKGASIITHYEQPELRPMADFDLLIKPSEVSPALTILKEIGYSVDEVSAAMLAASPQLTREFDHSIDCEHTLTGTKFDLHWQLGSFCSRKFADEFRLNVTDYSLIPGAVRPTLAYEVLFTIIHAVASGGSEHLHWIIDIDLLKLTQADWDEVRKLAITEEKEDMFNYGCAILLEHDVSAPQPLKVKKPKLPWIISEKNAATMFWPRLFALRFFNVVLYAKYLFPGSTTVGKLYNSFRRNSFKMSKAKRYLDVMRK